VLNDFSQLYFNDLLPFEAISFLLGISTVRELHIVAHIPVAKR
jgi:hypothetical protein